VDDAIEAALAPASKAAPFEVPDLTDEERRTASG
jgi:hypothetical protein